MVAYFFPPIGGAGVQRTLKFAKYLPDCDWKPIIVTPRHSQTRLMDPDLTAEISQQARIVRTADLRLPDWIPWRLRAWITRWLFIVDEHIGWLLFAEGASLECIRREAVQAIFSTSAPYTDHLIAYRLKLKTNLPWIADFRDPWVDNFSAKFPTRMHQRLVTKMEGNVIRTADRVLVVSEPMRQAILSRHPHIPPAKVIVLPNGYDPADFSALEQDMIEPTLEKDRLLIVYSGSFYNQRRTAKEFLQALKLSLDEQRLSREHLRVRFVGNAGKHTLEWINTLGLNDVCQATGYLPHRQSLAHVMAADVLLLIVGRGPGSEAVFTGKIFEYLASGKTILCLADPGAAADLVREARAGVVVDPEDIPAIATQIGWLYQQWASGRLNQRKPHSAVVKRYDRSALTAQLATILDEIASPETSAI
jgi:glycosyltransferase involved in cell wall biosynthesis